MAVAVGPKMCGPTGAPNVAASAGFSILMTSAPRSPSSIDAERAGAVLLDRDDPNAGERKHLRVIPRRIAAAASG